MTPEEFYTKVLKSGLDKVARFAPQLPRNRGVEVLMMSIAGTESNWTDRVQIPSGAAHGLFQMQLNTIEEIMANPASKALFELGMDDFGINNRTAEHLFGIIATIQGDHMAVFLARLDLWCNPHPIPFADEEELLFAYYRDTWRPAHADRHRFALRYAQALPVVPA